MVGSDQNRSELPTPAPAVVTPLPWDSGFFGFPVCSVRWDGPRGEAESELHAALHDARAAGFRLIYLITDAPAAVPVSLLADYRGLLVDEKWTFRAEVAELLRMSAASPPPQLPIDVVPLRVNSPTEAVVKLALAAGEYSRFRVDPRIGDERFRALYTTWIERSLAGEIADVVLCAVRQGAGDRPLGLVTVAVPNDTGQIGLLAVAGDARGLQVGRQLMTAAHQWIHGRGVIESVVTTQGSNQGACRFYQGLGYRLVQRETTYHFWPQAE